MNDTNAGAAFDPLAQLLESTGNYLLRLDPDSLRQLGELQGSVLGIEIREPAMRFYLLPRPEGLQVERSYNGEPDVTLRGTLWSFLRLAREGMSGELFHDGSLEMVGDAELGQQYQRLFGQLDLDWEELLSRFVGDTPARKLGNLLRGIETWTGDAGSSIKRNLGEFLQEERRDLASPLQSEEFIAGVDRLRSDIERLSQRVERLRQRLAPKRR